MRTDGAIAKILVPTDFSSGSQRAWVTASRLATTIGAEIVVLHVLPATPVEMSARYAFEEARAAERSRQAEHQLGIGREDADELPPLPYTFSGPLTGERVSDFSIAGREWAEKLENWVRLPGDAACTVTTLLRVGRPYEEIVAGAKEEDVDLIVMATHGRGEVHRLLVGSVADKVIRLAPCPVLTVKDTSVAGQAFA
ncbi:MAG TPA: universal stress protein [Methylomirabilota bacterium]|jgi:nucleotide-binding universal stress UspA family protein|nr:universal stress protein [Methylomirabilota bacterium]